MICSREKLFSRSRDLKEAKIELQMTPTTIWERPHFEFIDYLALKVTKMHARAWDTCQVATRRPQSLSTLI